MFSHNTKFKIKMSSVGVEMCVSVVILLLTFIMACSWDDRIITMIWEARNYTGCSNCVEVKNIIRNKGICRNTISLTL